MNSDKDTNATCVAKTAETPYDRLVIEKQQLDEKIVKLNTFLSNGEKAEKIAGYPQVGFMQRQLEIMLEYSSILNTRILRWKND